MSVLSDLLAAAGGLSVIGGGVGLVALFGRDRTAEVHDLSDYHAPAAAVLPGSRAAWPLIDRKPMPARRGVAPDQTAVDGRTPPLCRELLVAMAVPTLPDAAVRGIADEWLREIAAEQQTAAGIRPRVVSTADRDMTGAFPVVRTA